MSLNPMKLARHVNIKKRLLIVSLLLSTVPLIFIGSLAYFSAKSTLKEQIGSGLSGQAKETLDKIDRNIYERMQNIRVWSQLASMQDILIDDEDLSIQGELTRLKETYGSYQDIFVFNEDGALTASSNKDFSGEVSSGVAWFMNSMNGTVDIQDVSRSVLTNEIALSISAPVRADYDFNKILGVVTSRFDWKKIYEIADSVMLGGEAQDKSAYLILLNSDGVVISAPSFMRDGVTILNERHDELLSFRAAARGDSGYMIEEVAGKKMLVGYAPSTGHSDYVGIGWTMLVMQDAADAFAQVNALKYKIAIASIIAACLSLLLSLTISKSITGPVNLAVGIADRLADGDLDLEIEVKNSDETGKLMASMKHMIDKLRAIIMGVQDASDKVMSNSRDLSAGSEQMSRGVVKQTEKANLVATSSSEMSTTITEIAKNATEMAEFTSTTSNEAKEGKAIVDKTVKEVKGIETKVAESAELVAMLGKRSEEIGTIVGVINDIADQTNLLALNAAIEAARAGEQGRGFAVVADEVRKLAERTTGATKQIEEMIGTMQNETGKAVSSMDESIKMVGSGAELSAEAGLALEKIVESVGGLQERVMQIASASEEMSTSAEQINEDILVIANISTETNASSESILRTSDHLKGLATSLDEVLSVFSLGENNGRALPAGTDRNVAKLGLVEKNTESLSLTEGAQDLGDERSKEEAL
ncbi:MAG: methyl-accepting chemotaxis protein [Thermodesulfobacteriota bacterium]